MRRARSRRSRVGSAFSLISLHIGIFGAGAIGTYVGVRLSAAGHRVTLIGRPWLVDARSELEAITLSGEHSRPDDSLRVDTDPSALADVDACLVTVKSSGTAEAAATLAGVLSEGTEVISLQNGLGNARRRGVVCSPRVSVVPACKCSGL